MNPGKQSNLLPRKPLLLLAVAMLFTVLPLFGNLVPWVPAFFLGSLIVRFLMDWKGARLRSLPLKLTLVAAGFCGVALSYHSLVGPEPGLSICLVLIAVKVLEAHTARDFHILAALGWFFCVAVVMISQSLTTSAYSAIAFTLVLAAVLQFHRRPHAGRAFLVPLRDTLVLALQALPLVLALFFLFPRGNGGFSFMLNRSFSGRPGMSDSLSPGSVASLALSDEVAFRVEFPDGGMPAPSGMYWRGGVFARGDGMNWTPLRADAPWARSEALEGNPIRQRILLPAHGDRWVFALDKPVNAPRGMTLTRGNVLLANTPIRNTIQYEVTSLPKSRKSELLPLERKICLQLTPVSPAIRALVDSWTQLSADPKAVVAKGLDFFRTENFRYTLTPGEYTQDALDEFLFRRRIGFCEHYAAAFATLMRAAGVPSRIVVGYQGGEYNARGRYLIVRQSYAHAWCEVWLPNTGWERVDPTAVVTPDRVNSGLEASGAGAEEGGIRRVRRHWMLRELQLAWDSLSYQWEANVAGFDEAAQQSLFLQLGLLNSRPAALLGWLMLVVAIVVAVQALAGWLKGRPVRDPLVILYERFCPRAGALGAKREAWEGPLEFAERAAQLIPSHAERIRRISALYTALRYAAKPAGQGNAELAKEIRIFCSGA